MVHVVWHKYVFYTHWKSNANACIWFHIARHSSAMTPVWKWFFKQAGSLFWRRFFFTEMSVCTMRSEVAIWYVDWHLILKGLEGEKRKGIGKSDERKYSYKCRRCIIYRVYIELTLKMEMYAEKRKNSEICIRRYIYIYKWSFLSHINFGETITLSRAISQKDERLRLTQKKKKKKNRKK